MAKAITIGIEKGMPGDMKRPPLADYSEGGEKKLEINGKVKDGLKAILNSNNIEEIKAIASDILAEESVEGNMEKAEQTQAEEIS